MWRVRHATGSLHMQMPLPPRLTGTRLLLPELMFVRADCRVIRRIRDNLSILTGNYTLTTTNRGPSAFVTAGCGQQYKPGMVQCAISICPSTMSDAPLSMGIEKAACEVIKRGTYPVASRQRDTDLALQTGACCNDPLTDQLRALHQDLNALL